MQDNSNTLIEGAETIDASAEPAARVRQLISLTAALNAIFTKENEALRSARPSAIAPLQADKARLAAAYAQSIRDVARDRGAVAASGERLISELRDITREFESRAREQQALIAGAQTAVEGVLGAIANEASNTTGYQPGGCADRKNPAPIAFSEKA